MALGVGVFAGISTTIFLFLLAAVSQYRDSHGYIIWCLPAAGFVIGALYHYLGRDVVRGTNIVLNEVNSPRRQIPFRLAPLVLLGTLLTHLFGGSAGREGTAVQMAAALADQCHRFFKWNREERRTLLVAGMGAGFGSAVGAPIAGIVFGLELARVKRHHWRMFAPSAVASIGAYATSLFLHAPHTDYPEVVFPPFHWTVLVFVLAAGVVFGGATFLYLKIAHTWEEWFKKIKYAPLRPVAGGFFLIGLFYYEGSYRYIGLGIESIQSAFLTPSFFMDPWYKLVFTALTIASGFKGGEFIPMVFIGSTLGSCVGIIFPAYYSLAAGLGFASVFGAASKTPLACSIMAIELFGPPITPYILVCCFLATYISGHRRLYSADERTTF